MRHITASRPSRFRRILATIAGATLLLASAAVLAPHQVTSASASSTQQSRKAESKTRVVVAVPSTAKVGHATLIDLAGTEVASNARLEELRISFGDGRRAVYHTLKTQVRHVYQSDGMFKVRVELVDTKGTRRQATAFAGVTKADRVVLGPHTRQLPTAAFVSFTPLSADSEQVVLKRNYVDPAPVRDEVLLFPKSELLPHGLAMVVDTSQTDDATYTVTGHDATLSQIYSTFRVAQQSAIPDQVTATRTNADGTVDTRTMRTGALPFNCTAGASSGLSVSVDVADSRVDSYFDLSLRVAQVIVAFRPHISATANLSGHVHCSLAGGFQLNIPVGATGVLVTLAPYLDFDASATVTATAVWSPRLLVAINRSPQGNQTTTSYRSELTADVHGTVHVNVSAGLSIDVSVAHALGIEARVGPVLDLDSQLNPTNACLRATGHIHLDVTAYYDVIILSGQTTLYQGDYFPSTFFDLCWNTQDQGGGSGSGSGGGGTGGTTGSGAGGTPATAPYVGPSVPETTGSVAQTWTDYVHAGGTQGPSIPANTTVGVVCKTLGFRVPDGNTWWYRIASAPWNAAYYVSADPFYNNGQTSGPLRGTPFVDQAVPDCSSAAGAPGVLTTPPGSSTPVVDGTWTETAGGSANTWSNYSNAGGTQGQTIAAGQSVQISCAVNGFEVADGNISWYRIASAPWNNNFYVSADAFYNNGQTSGSLRGTPFVDPAVPQCDGGGGGGGTGGGGGGTPQPQSWSETVGGVTHTWTNYTNAGGTQGPSIQPFQTVQIACKLQGFKVADGNTWWYRIASSPWNGAFYASADAFYNNGQTSGPLQGTPFVDPAVANC